MTSTNQQKHLQWAVESGAVLILIGAGLNFLVMQTLGSFDAASVILALFLGFWAFVLGNSVLFLSSIGLFMKRRAVTENVATGRFEAREHRPLGLQPMRQVEPCRC